MSVAFTFPGQGSQAVGMGKDLADAFPEARAVFNEVDEALGQKLSAIMWEGPEETLTLTSNAQPALMAVSMAAIRVLEARGITVLDHVAYVAGHSLGEYSALCAAGMLSLSDTARLLRIRGDAMQAAVPVGEGAMAAIIGLEPADVEAACAEAGRGSVCQIANDNGGGQLVISGAKAAVEQAAEPARNRVQSGIGGRATSRVGETHRALQVAALRDFQQRRARLLPVIGAQTAIERAALIDRCQRRARIRRDLGPRPVVVSGRSAPDDRLKWSVCRAGLAQQHVVPALDPFSGDARQAFGAGAFGARQDLILAQGHASSSAVTS